MAPHSSILAWKIPWTEEPGRLQSMGSLRVGHDWATSFSLFTFMHWRRKWQPTPVFLPGESQGRGSLVGCRLWGRRVGHDCSDAAVAKSLHGDCSCETKRRLLLGREVMTNLDSILKSRGIILSTKVHLIKAMVFPVVMYGCESWAIKKAEHWRIDAFERWHWRRLLRVPCSARRSNQAIPKEISPEICLPNHLQVPLIPISRALESYHCRWWLQPWN